MPRLLPVFLKILASLLLLVGCKQVRPGTDPDAPMFGSAKTNSTFLVSSEEPVGVDELARIARIIGPYRQLQPQEMTALELRLERELNRLVEIEYQQMLKEEKSGNLPRQYGGKKVTRETARERLLARLGKDLALPLLTSDNRSAVVFSRISKGDIKISPTAYEIQHSATDDLPQQVITPSGFKATVIDPLP